MYPPVLLGSHATTGLVLGVSSGPLGPRAGVQSLSAAAQRDPARLAFGATRARLIALSSGDNGRAPHRAEVACYQANMACVAYWRDASRCICHVAPPHCLDCGQPSAGPLAISNLVAGGVPGRY